MGAEFTHHRGFHSWITSLYFFQVNGFCTIKKGREGVVSLCVGEQKFSVD
jgi:hypothetical protein